MKNPGRVPLHFVPLNRCLYFPPLPPRHSHFVFSEQSIILAAVKPIPMNLIKKLTQAMDQYKLIDVALIVLIAFFVVAYKMVRS